MVKRFKLVIQQKGALKAPFLIFNAAYKERPNFDGRVYVNVSCSGVTGSMLDGWARSWYTSIASSWTAQPGFSVSLSSDCSQANGPNPFTFGVTLWYNFSYTVKSNTTSEVVSGNSIYTLSPLMVNGYRLACGSKVTFNGTIYVHIRYDIGFVGGGDAHEWFIEVKSSPSASTSMQGYSCILSNIFWNSYKTYKTGGYENGLPGGMEIKQPLIANYTVLSASGAVKLVLLINRFILILQERQQAFTKRKLQYR